MDLQLMTREYELVRALAYNLTFTIKLAYVTSPLFHL